MRIRKMFSLPLLAEFLLIELFGVALWYRKRFKIVAFDGFSPVQNLAYVVRVVGKLPLDGLQHGLAFVADVNNSSQVGWL